MASDINEDFLFAVQSDMLELVETLLDQGADIHYNDDKALFIACVNRNRELISLLIERGADVSARNSRCLLHIVSNSDEDYSNYDLFLEAGARVTKGIVMAVLFHENLPTEIAVDILERYPDINAENGALLREMVEMGSYYKVNLVLDAGATEGLEEALRTVEYDLDNERFSALLGNYDLIAIESLLRSKLNLPPRDDRNAVLGEDDVFSDAGSEYNYEIDDENKRADRIRQAREREEKNELLRAAALEEVKNASNSSENLSSCSNSENLYGDPIDENDVIIFIIDNQNKDIKGECLTKEEIQGILSGGEQVFLWKGPPLGPSRPPGVPAGARIEESPVFKLPWSGNWVLKSVLEEALESKEKTTLVLQGIKASIGSDFGVSNLHGQWGGKWGFEYVREYQEDEQGVQQVVNVFQRVVPVPTEDFQPDERYLVYFVKEIIPG